MKKSKIGFTTLKLSLLAVFASLVLTASVQAAVYTVTKTADTNDGICNSDCSLREAIAAANATADNDTVEFNASLSGQTITLGGTQLTIANNGTLTINGLGATQLAVSGNNASRVFFVNNGATAAISGLTITAARFTGGNGGGIVADSSSILTLSSLRVISNYGASGGGILASSGSTVNLTDSTVSNNDTFRAGGSLGGGLYNDQGTVTIANSTFSGNNAGFGGGVFSKGPTTITNSTFTMNTANLGGGISNGAGFLGISSSGVVMIADTTLNGNIASNSGGGLYVFGRTTMITNTSFTGNMANFGAGFYNERGTVTITGSSVSNNTATNEGGGFSNNTNVSGGSVTVNDSVIDGNRANTASGGGIATFGIGTLTVNTSTISNNTSTNSGGGIIVFSGTANLTNSTVSGNTSTGGNGGGIRNLGTATLTSSTFSDNSGNIGGGVSNGNTMMIDNTIVANSLNGIDCGSTAGTINAVFSLIESGLACVNGSNSNNLTGDPNLDSLADNGGATLTHALLPGSPAIDQGNGSGTDQRGAARPSDFFTIPNASGGNSADIGAFEAEAPPDLTPPVITPTVSGTLGNDGWYVSDVQVSWSVSDAESPVSSTTSCDTQTVSSDTSGITFTCSAQSAGGTSSESVSFKRDATAPTLAPTVTPNPVLSGGTATAAANASDNLSGVVSESCETPETALIGTKSLTCTATDAAGNTATATVTYQVNSRFAFSGFLQPVENMPAVNIVNAGQAVPVKFSLGGNYGLNIFAAGYPVSGSIPCDATEAGSVIEETVTAGGSTLTYDPATGRYSYVWKTDRAWKDTCRIFVLRLVDGSQYMAKFRFK